MDEVHLGKFSFLSARISLGAYSLEDMVHLLQIPGKKKNQPGTVQNKKVQSMFLFVYVKLVYLFFCDDTGPWCIFAIIFLCSVRSM